MDIFVQIEPWQHNHLLYSTSEKLANNAAALASKGT